jgi:tetratricopeptide (TPR) repeat protein
MIETTRKKQSMKKLVLMATLMVAGMIAQAQAKVTSAYNANKEGKYEAAKGFIDEALSDPKATEKEKFWRYRGNIYANIVKDSVLFAKYPDAFSICLESFKKQIEIDKRKDYLQDVAQELDLVKVTIGQRAEKKYKANDLGSAGDLFLNIAEISAVYGVMDTAFVYNAAFCHHKAKMYEKAKSEYTTCIQYKHNLRESYLGMSEILIAEGKKAEAVSFLSDARKSFPKDADLLRAEVNIYIEDKDYKKAQDVLKALSDTDPNNESVWFVLGVTFEKENNVAEAENSYLKALAIKPDYFDAAYNVGALYYNKAVEKNKECDAIPMNQADKFNACKTELKPMFLKAAEYFEICYKQDSNDAQLKQALKECYLKGGQKEKANQYR